MDSVFSPGSLYLHGYIFQLFCCWHGLTTPGCISDLRRTPRDELQNCDEGHELTRPSLCLPSRKPDQRLSQSTFLKYTCLLLPLQKATSGVHTASNTDRLAAMPFRKVFKQRQYVPLTATRKCPLECVSI